MNCLSEDQVLAILAGESDELAAGQWDEHLDQCADCRQMLAALAVPAAGGTPAAFERQLTIELGVQVARDHLVSWYEGYDLDLGRHVLVVALDDETRVADFAEELRVSANLDHASIAIMLHCGRLSDGRTAAVYATQPNDTMTRTAGSLVIAEQLQRLDLIAQLVDGLAFAHAKAIVHGSVGWDAVRFDRAGSLVTIYSFGSQWRRCKTNATVADDVRAVGLMLRATMAPRSLRGALGSIVHATDAVPSPYASAVELRQDLLRFRRGEPVSVHDERWRGAAMRFARRHRWPVTIVAAGATLLLALLASTWLAWRSQTQRSLQASETRRNLAETIKSTTKTALANRAEYLKEIEVTLQSIESVK
jgi:hypothetical protein